MNPRLAVAGIWGFVFFAVAWLFVESLGVATAAVAISAGTCGFLASAAGWHLTPFIFPPEAPTRSRAPGLEWDCPLCGRGNLAAAAACESCGEPIGGEPTRQG